MLPQQAPVKNNFTLTVLGIFVLFFYTFQNFIPGIGSLPRPISYGLVVVIFIITVLLFLPELKRDAPVFFRYLKDYCSFFFPKFGIFFLLYFAVAVTVTMLVQAPSANQAALYAFPLPLLAFSALIYAPILEEIIYRGFLRRAFSSDTMFIVVSALIFGGIHMMHPGQDMTQMLYLFEYALLGGFLAYLYAKSDNIFVSMLGHFCLNFIALIPMLIA